MTGVTLKATLPMMLCMGVLVWLSSFIMGIPSIIPDGGLVVVGSNLVPWGVVSGLFGIILGFLWRENSLRSVLAFAPKSGCFADTSESLQSLRERMQAIQREASRRERELIKSETQVCPLTTLSTHPSHGKVDGCCDLQFNSAQGQRWYKTVAIVSEVGRILVPWASPPPHILSFRTPWTTLTRECGNDPFWR